MTRQTVFLLFPSKKPTTDWDTINGTVKENKDFLGFVAAVPKFYQTDNPSAHDWEG